ncbi:ASCH domain-containing protein [uncultured Kiloniella sp.]|uniref:ASCH domain-containing protein n=1 Tax=uncultured Kiloniella sp. TaxID=1133091 RepID=UPI0026182709|nr:ASCH domain-containing protein [uncultured Kiloniella sp.]
MAENPLRGSDEKLEAFWKSCWDYIPAEDRNASFSSWFFGDSAELADDLLALVLEGKKTATCGALFDYEHDNEDPPEQGSYHILTDFAGMPRCLIQMTSVSLAAFCDVSEEFALAEGEGTFAEWRRAHQEFFTRRAEATGNSFNKDTLLVLERFKLIYPVK